jgi:ribonuclease D
MMDYQTIVVSSGSEADSAVESLSKCKILGFDMEWKPVFTRGATSPIAIIQLSSGDVCVIFPLKRLNGMPYSLRNLLIDPSIIKIGCGTRNDELKLLREYRLEVASLVDVNDIAINLGITKIGLRNLSMSMLHVVMPKGRKVTTSNWERWPLTDSQIRYAALDAVITRRIYLALIKLPLRHSTEKT